jgi:ADP-ribosylglycohydrolase
VDVLDHSLDAYPWVHTVNNAARIAAGLLWGEGDFGRTVALTVSAGGDTDSTAATAGSVIGVMTGGASLPAPLVKPLGAAVRSAVRDYDGIQIAELARRTAEVRSTT